MNLGFYFCLMIPSFSNAIESSTIAAQGMKDLTQNTSLNSLNVTYSTPLNVTNSNSTIGSSVFENTDMLYRGFYVFLGVTILVVLYFGIKTYRTKQRPSRSYGLIASRGETIELNPLDSDSEDDFTVFENRKLTS